MIKIEQLESKTSQIKSDLDNLKNDVNLSETQKREKAQEIFNNAETETIKKDVEQKINELESQTWEDSQKEIERAKTLLRNLDEINTLYNDIMWQETNEQNPNQNNTNQVENNNGSSNTPSSEVQSEDKSILWTVGNWFWNAKEWIWEQWSDVWNTDKRKEDWRKNWLRTAWFVVTWVWAVSLAVKWVKKLWNWAFWSDDEEEEREEKPEKKEKKFWDTWYGKLFKWTGIWTWIYYVAHGLSTGKWDLSHFFDRKHNWPTSTAEENFDNYTELSKENPEKYKEYEKIWESINVMYDKIWDTEKNYFWANSQIVLWAIWDKAKEQKIKKDEKFEDIETRWLVPYSLDNFYNNVWDMISCWWVNRYLRSKNIEEYQQKIKSFWAEWFDKAMVPFLSWFANFGSFWIVSTDTAQQKMDKYFQWIRDNAWENLDILDLFFRQYTKVLTYMADKKNALASKKAREILSTQWYNGESWPSNEEEQEEMINEAINDSEWVDKNLKGTKYWEFMSSSIVWAYNILKEEWLDNTEMTKELNDVVNDVDEQTAKLLWWFDDNAFVKAEEKLNWGWTLEASEKDGLKKVADDTIEDLKSSKDWGWLYNTFDYCFELLWLEEADKQTILNETWISKALDETASSIQSLQAEISTNPTKENVSKLKKVVWEYTSMKKEIAVALYAINEAKENKDLWDYVSQVIGAVVTWFTHFIWSVNDLIHWRADVWDIINIFIWMTISWWVLKFGWRLSWKQWAVVAGHYVKKAWLAPVTLVEMWIWRTKWSWAVKHRINELAKVNPTKAENLMKKKILDWVLNKKHVAKILQNNEHMKASFNITWFQDNERVFKEVVNNIFWDGKKAEAELFTKYYRKVNWLVSYSKESVRNWWLDGKFIINIDTKWFEALKEFDIEFDKLWNTVQKSYFESMLRKVKWWDDMKLLKELILDDEFKNIIKSDNIDMLKKIKLSELRAMKENGLLWKVKSGQITLNQALDELKRVWKPAWEAIDTLSDARKAFNKSIDKAIKSLEERWNKELAEIHINKLKGLKNDMSLVDDEMEGFVKFMDEWFDAKLIPDIKKLFGIADEMKGWWKVWERLKQLLKEWNYTEFRRILNQKEYSTVFKKANVAVKKIVENFDVIFKRFWWVTADVSKVALKSFFRVLAKIL